MSDLIDGMKQITVESKKELGRLVKRVEEAAGASTETLRRLLDEESSPGVLGAMKFRKIGSDPLDPTRHLNLVEQINQTLHLPGEHQRGREAI